MFENHHTAEQDLKDNCHTHHHGNDYPLTREETRIRKELYPQR